MHKSKRNLPLSTIEDQMEVILDLPYNNTFFKKGYVHEAIEFIRAMKGASKAKILKSQSSLKAYKPSEVQLPFGKPKINFSSSCRLDSVAKG